MAVPRGGRRVGDRLARRGRAALRATRQAGSRVRRCRRAAGTCGRSRTPRRSRAAGGRGDRVLHPDPRDRVLPAGAAGAQPPRCCSPATSRPAAPPAGIGCWSSTTQRPWPARRLQRGSRPGSGPPPLLALRRSDRYRPFDLPARLNGSTCPSRARWAMRHAPHPGCSSRAEANRSWRSPRATAPLCSIRCTARSRAVPPRCSAPSGLGAGRRRRGVLPRGARGLGAAGRARPGIRRGRGSAGPPARDQHKERATACASRGGPRAPTSAARSSSATAWSSKTQLCTDIEGHQGDSGGPVYTETDGATTRAVGIVAVVVRRGLTGRHRKMCYVPIESISMPSRRTSPDSSLSRVPARSPAASSDSAAASRARAWPSRSRHPAPRSS